MTSSALRPLSLGELLDRTFSLYKSHFVIFVGIVALPNLLSLVFQVLMISMRAVQPRSTQELMDHVFQLFGASIVLLIVAAVAQAATVIAVSNLHLGRPVSIASAFRALKGRIFVVCLVTFVVGLTIGVVSVATFFLLCIPGIYLALCWSVAVPVTVLESADLGTAMSRSRALTKGDRGRIFVVYVLYFALVLVFSAIWEIAGMALNLSGGGTLASPTMAMQILLQIGGFVTQGFVGPLITIALALIYYDERVRKEAFDIEHMIAEIDRTAAPADGPL
jgi:hypothetical protein